MNERELLLAYGEWLDAQGLIVPEDASGDKRSLDQLGAEFIASLRDEVSSGDLFSDR